MPELREYQTRAIADTRAAYASGARAVCLVCPTGSGKTVMSAEMIRLAITRGNRVLFLVHRQELVRQSVDKLGRAGVHDIRVIRAGSDLGSRQAPVTVASIPTLTRWTQRLPEAEFCVVDECHHVVAKTWSRLASHYRSALLLGLTATPQRADGKPLGDIFDSLVVGARVRELMDLDHLVPCRVFAPPMTLEAAQLALSPVEAYRRHTPGERAVVFCTTVEHAQGVAQAFRDAGISAATVHGSMPGNLRRQTLADLDAGTLRVVTSIHALTEGWDSPATSTCILARKPQHTGLYLQMAGRVLRPSPGKTHATLIDLCGSVHDHGTPDLDREYTLGGRGISKADRDAIRQCPACAAVFRVGPQSCPVCGAELPRREITMPIDTGIGVIDLSTLPKLPPRAVTLSIQAKYPSVCRKCRGRVAVGADVYWVKGEGVRHVACPEEKAA